MDAAEFGVPQRRHRAVLLALRDGQSFKWPAPTHKNAPVRAFDAIGDLNLSNLPVSSGRWADLLPSIPEGKTTFCFPPSGGGRPFLGIAHDSGISC